MMDSVNPIASSAQTTQSGGRSSPLTMPNAIGLVAFCILVFAVVVFFSTRHNDYPVYFHQNSGGQTKEVIHGKHNFKQPLLIVTATQLADVLTGTPDTSQDICELGNTVAAVFGGLAAVNLVLLAFLLRGWLGAVSVGGIMSLCSPLIYYGHFFKEDTALVFGVTLVFLTLGWFAHRPTRRSIVLVGIACGLAASGKYAGILTLAFALPMIMLMDVRRGDAPLKRSRRWLPFGAAFAGAFLVANYPIIRRAKKFIEGVVYEIGHASSGVSSHGYQNFDRAKSLHEYGRYLEYELPSLVVAAAGVGLLVMVLRWKHHATIEKVLVLFAIVFALIVTQSTVQQSRHFLPTLVLLHFIAGMGIVHLVSWRVLGRTIPWILAGLLCLPVMYAESQRVLDRNSEFPRDSRYLMTEWIRVNLPAEAKIAADTTCGLPDPEFVHHDGERRRLPQEVVTGRYAPDLGTLDELIAQGFTHVAVSSKRISQVSSEERVPIGQEVPRHLHRNNFYTEVQERGTLIWKSHTEDSPVPRTGFSSKKVMLYRLPEQSLSESFTP